MCSYINILAPDSYVNVNKKLIKMVGFATATYFTLLLDVLKEVQNKKTYDPETGFFTLQRIYISKEIGLPPEEQKNSDEILVKLGVLHIDPENKNKLAIDVKAYQELLINDEQDPETLLSSNIKLTKAQKQINKTDAIKMKIVALFGETDEITLKSFTTLVDVYYDKGYCKNAQWIQVINLLKQTAKSPEEFVKIVDYIIATNWQSIPSAVDTYTKTCQATNATRTNKPQITCTKVNTKQVF